MIERLHKVLAAAGVMSRRHAELLIAAGRVTVNGQVAHVGQTVGARDHIAVDGQTIERAAGLIYIALNKPVGVVSSTRSTHGETTVLDLVAVSERVFPVGRLDKDSAGLTLLTNDGEWANLVTHPRYGVEKEYRALVRGVPSAEDLEKLRVGIRLGGDTVTAPAGIVRIRQVRGDTLLSVTVIEGKKRQIRLMCEAIGHRVLELRRLRVGPIVLADLPLGSWRYLRRSEVEEVRVESRRAASCSQGFQCAGGNRRSGGSR